MQPTPLFDQHDYKSYLNQRLDSDARGRGSRSALARAIRCQTAYVSSVLRGSAHFTPEQGEAINEHLGHSELEADYFLLLLQQQRAGTESLKRRLKKQMERIQESRFDLKKRLTVGQALTKEDQATYYSEWHYAAIHTLSSIPEFSSVARIAEKLHLEPALVADAVEFLLRTGLMEKSKAGVKIGKAHIHLGADSPLISKHHQNWRLQAMQRLTGKSDGLHYSSIVTLSEKDSVRLKEMMVGFIQSVKAVVKESKEEQLRCFSLDFFRL
jgi:uncharacterized protein (TIGR02147 family)